MTTPYNNVGVLTATIGTISMVLGGAINTTYLTEVEAGVPNAAVVSYVILQGNDIETGRGTYTSASRTLSRDTVTFSKIGGTAGTTKITLDGSAEVRLTQLAADIVPVERAITAGAGLTGGGNLTADRTLDVGAGTGITVAADSVGLDTAHARNVDHTGVTLTAGAGLTGGGDISASRTFDVGAGTGITVNADNVALTVPVTATLGGTGQTTYATGDILYSNATNSLAKLAGNTTTAKQYLSQTGTGSASQAPAWAAITGADVTGAALTKTDDTNVTLTLGGTPATSLLRAASITAGWTGTLAPGRGGTGVANNAASTITISGGAFGLTLNLVGATNITLPNTGTLLQNGTNSNISFTATTASTSSSTGALVVSGGVGVEGAVYASGGLRSASSTAGIGYASGAGASVTQATSKSTSVTINAVCGKILTHNATLNSYAIVAFTVFNSAMKGGDTVAVSIDQAMANWNSYSLTTGTYSGDGFFGISIVNLGASNLSDAIPIYFTIIRGGGVF